MKKLLLFLLVAIGYQLSNAIETETPPTKQQDTDPREQEFEETEARRIELQLNLLKECREKADEILTLAYNDAIKGNKNNYIINKQFQDLNEYLKIKPLLDQDVMEATLEAADNKFVKTYGINREKYKKIHAKRKKMNSEQKKVAIRDQNKRLKVLEESITERKTRKNQVISGLKIEECAKKCNAKSNNYPACNEQLNLRKSNLDNYKGLTEVVNKLDVEINNLEFEREYNIRLDEFHKKMLDEEDDNEDNSSLLGNLYSGITSIVGLGK